MRFVEELGAGVPVRLVAERLTAGSYWNRRVSKKLAHLISTSACTGARRRPLVQQVRQSIHELDDASDDACMLCVLPHGRNRQPAVWCTKAKIPTASGLGEDTGKDMNVVDFRNVKKRPLILVVENVYETRAGIDTLLKSNGYRVALASAEREAINIARLDPPDLILVSGSALPDNVLVKAINVRKEAGVDDEIPVVVFCAQDISEGEEVAIGRNVYLTNPDNFNQLRSLIARLLVACSRIEIAAEEQEQTLEIMTNNSSRAPLAVRFMDTKPRMLMEITNTTETTLKSVEILTVFLKDEEGPSGPSRAHIRFDVIKSVKPNEKAVVSHRTWINGRPVSDAQDQIGRLESVAGAVKPYVLDISWEDMDGKIQFQRIAVGH